MTPKAKKIIAQEGLVILGILLIVLFGGIAHHIWWWKTFKRYVAEKPYFHINTVEESFGAVAIILFGLYFVQWIVRFVIRFIIWAVKTLKK